MGFGANFLGLSPYINAIMRDYMAQQNMQRQLQMQQQLMKMRDEYQQQHQQQVYGDYLAMSNNEDITNMFAALGSLPGGGFMEPAMKQVETIRNNQMVYPLEAIKLKQSQDAFELQQAATRTQIEGADVRNEFSKWKNDITKKQYESNKKLASSFGNSILQIAKTIGIYNKELEKAVKDAEAEGDIEILTRMWKMISAGGQIKTTQDWHNRYIKALQSRGAGGGGGSGLSATRYNAQLIQKEGSSLDKDLKGLISPTIDKNTGVYQSILPINTVVWLDAAGNINEAKKQLRFDTKPISDELRGELKKVVNVINNNKLSDKDLKKLLEYKGRVYTSALPKLLSLMQKQNLITQAKWLKNTSDFLVKRLSRLAAISYLSRKYANSNAVPNESEIYEWSQKFQKSFSYVANAYAWHKLVNPQSDDEKVLNALVMPYLGPNATQLLNALARSSLGFWQGGANVTGQAH